MSELIDSLSGLFVNLVTARKSGETAITIYAVALS